MEHGGAYLHPAGFEMLKKYCKNDFFANRGG
jgi:hypothetical protein